MKHYYKYKVDYLKFNEENNKLETKSKCLLKEMTKWQFAQVVIVNVLVTLIVCLVLITLSCLGFVEEGFPIITSLIVWGLFFGICGAGICFGRLYDYDCYLYYYDEDLIDKFFAKEIKELELLSIQEQLKAEQWRATHPLEEKCRLAMTKNPNYVADLIRYVKENTK